jgi:hypothetical protein
MTLVLNPSNLIKKRLGINKGGAVHKFFTSTCAKHCDRYIPYRDGTLSETTLVGTETITYQQPYASYVYYGIRADGTHEIKKYTLDRNPEAGPIWDERMWTANKEIIAKEVMAEMERVGGK